jgi:hypothetical protein
MIFLKSKAAILFIVLCTCTGLSAFGQKDSTYRLSSCKKIEDKRLVKRVRLANRIVTKRKTIPADFSELKNLEYLSLRPAVNKYIKYRGVDDCVIVYYESSIRFLPEWLPELPYLNELDLIGITKINYGEELKKISKLPNLEYLSIDPDEVTKEQLTILCTLTKLKSLKIRCDMKNEDLAMLTSSLPECKIVTGAYERY